MVSRVTYILLFIFILLGAATVASALWNRTSVVIDDATTEVQDATPIVTATPTPAASPTASASASTSGTTSSVTAQEATAIDADLAAMDATINAVSENDFAESTLSDSSLGL